MGDLRAGGRVSECGRVAMERWMAADTLTALCVVL